MPMTLPMRRSRGANGREDDLHDPALLLLHDAGEHREPEAEDADEDQHGADVREQELRVVRLGLRVQRMDGGCLLGGKQLCRRDARLGHHGLRPQGDHRRGHELGHELVRLLVETDLAGTGQVGRHDRDALDRLVGERRISGGLVGERHDLDLAVELAGGRGDRQGQAGRFRLDDPDLRRVIVAEQQRRNDERPHHEHGRERDRQDEAATAAALDHLAPGHEPDAPPATHRVSSTTGRRCGRHGFHEQLRQLRWLIGERPDLAGRPGPREERVEIDVLGDQQLHPVAAALQDGQLAPAVEPGAIRSGDLDLEMAAPRTRLQLVDRARRRRSARGR